MKSVNFIVEMIEDGSDRTYVLRQTNGQPLKIVSSPDELVSFLREFKI